MNNRPKIVSTAALITFGMFGVASAALASPPPWAHAHGHYDRDRRRDYHQSGYRDTEYARVIDVQPIVRRVRVSSPQRECWSEERPAYRPYSGPSHTEIRSTLIGGLIGAAVGHQIGAVQHVRDPAAIIGGSLIGAAIGNTIGVHKAERRGEYRDSQYDHEYQRDYQPVQRCQVNYRDELAEQIDGYQVTYVYQGREYTTRMPYDPGQRVRVNVDVDVATHYGDDHDD